MAEKVTGPASYFPSIEKKYGKSISHWKSLLKKMKSAKHAEMVAMLKTDHEMGMVTPMQSWLTSAPKKASSPTSLTTGRERSSIPFR